MRGVLPLCVCAIVLLGSCTHLSQPHSIAPGAPGPAAPANDYIDLQAGWRLRVTTPLLKPGVQRPAFHEQRQHGLTITLNADDLIGYETSFYAVKPRREGVHIELASVESTRDGRTTRERRPRRGVLPDIPRRMRFVRLIYLTRLSHADHDMALAAAESIDALEALTLEVRRDPAACGTRVRSLCEWIPQGVAVVAEHQTGPASWSPVR
jgi:hypothetical protein